jgi:hypothetical protein
MNIISKTVKFIIVLLVITMVMGCNRNSLPKIETVDNFKDISWAGFISEDFAFNQPRTKGQWSFNADELLGIGVAQCSTDSASIEAAKYWAISGLVQGILKDSEPDDIIFSYWPDMVYELSGLVQVQIRNFAKTTDGQFICLVSIKKNEADKLKDNLWKKWEILEDNSPTSERLRFDREAALQKFDDLF